MRKSSLHRRGTIAPFVIFALTTLLGFFAIAVNKNWLWAVREDLRTVADAAALAAAQDLVNDDLLRGDVHLVPPILDRATTTAATFAALNTVRARPLQLRENLADPRLGDVLFGVLSTPRAGDFSAVPGRNQIHVDQVRTNTVVITGRQTRARGTAQGLTFGALFARTSIDVAVVSAVTLDRGIRGVCPRTEATPLSPIALFSDPTGTDPKSWEFAVEARNGKNEFRLDPQTDSFVADSVGDGIHEFTATLAAQSDQAAVGNAALLFFGSSDLSHLASLLSNGVTTTDLLTLGGRFVLPAGGSGQTAGTNVAPASDDTGMQLLYLALDGLRQSGKIRIWPLYSSADANQVAVSGFVAARVVNVTPPEAEQPLKITLKATMIHRTDVVTDTDLRGRDATMNSNAYICKIRRIE